MSHNARILTLPASADLAAALEGLGSDKEGVRIMLPKGGFHLIELECVDVRAANIIKQEMLSRGGEAAVSRSTYVLEPAQKTDVILMGTRAQFRDVIPKLGRQPFGLRLIAKEIEQVLDDHEAPPGKFRLGEHCFDFSARTYVMGILNVTPDSFSEAGEHFERRAAVEHGLRMVAEGADIVDVGGESTRPGAEVVSLGEELDRVIPVIQELVAQAEAPVSIDTYKVEVAREALSAGAVLVNDITALSDSRMAELAAERGVSVALMHMQGTPKTMQADPHYDCLMGEIAAFLRRRTDAAKAAGIGPDRILIDPGIGFGKTVEHNLEIMRRLPELRSLGLPILLGTSRKSFIGLTLDVPATERLEGTAATVAYGIAQGASMVRVHDVAAMAKVARMTDAMVGKGA